LVAQTSEITIASVNRCDGSLKSNVSHRQDIGISQNHDAEDRNGPWADTLYVGENLFPSSSALHIGENSLGLLKDVYTTTRPPFGEPERTKGRDTWHDAGRVPREHRVSRFHTSGETTSNTS
jgi:hypothetical protein